MRFRELIKQLPYTQIINSADADITGVSYDSRAVLPGHVFIAIQGGSFDGHDYIPAALANGARAVLAERPLPGLSSAGVPCVVVPDGRAAMGELAARFYGFPSRRLKLVGVTGTSGKTTVTHIIQSIFNASGRCAGLIGTLGARIGDELIDTAHTTPESADIQRLLARMADSAVAAAAMEVSSHGLYQGRTLGCEFDCAVLTNVARDHLDFHGTVEAYLEAKLILFRDYPAMSEKPFTAVLNADDSSVQKARQASGGNVVTFGVDSPADFTASQVSVTDRSVSFDLNCPAGRFPVQMALGGLFNVYNALAAAAAASSVGVETDDIIRGLASVTRVPGRFESVECGQDFGVLVDYAHTPDELENVLAAARKITGGRLIAVFGCGGDRDRGKRPIMGEIATRLADSVVVTSDNPRSEDPHSIIEEILGGIDGQSRARVVVEADRADAIRWAIRSAESGDIVVIAGKGHEDYQIFADRTIYFDDREVARNALTECA